MYVLTLLPPLLLAMLTDVSNASMCAVLSLSTHPPLCPSLFGTLQYNYLLWWAQCMTICVVHCEVHTNWPCVYTHRMECFGCVYLADIEYM